MFDFLNSLSKLQWDVNRYQNQHSFVWEYGSSLLDLVFDDDDTKPTSDLKILDLGCGSGELTAQLAERSGGEVIGLDADPEMVQRASEQYPNVKFVHGDMRNFDLGESRFDIIFSNAALHWVPPKDADLAVAAISRAMRPGAKLVVEFGGKGNVEVITKALEKQLGVSSPWYFPSVADFTTRLETVGGIETTMAHLYDRPTPLSEGSEGLKNWLRMFGNAFWKDSPAEAKLDEILDLVENEARPALWDGKIWKADYRRLRIVGKKL